jgi:hypothetical protein
MPIPRQQAAPRSVGAALRAAAREARETMAGVTLIVRFAIFVAAILVEHHLRRLWRGAARRRFGVAIAAVLRHAAAMRHQVALLGLRAEPMALGRTGSRRRDASCAPPQSRPRAGATLV